MPKTIRNYPGIQPKNKEYTITIYNSATEYALAHNTRAPFADHITMYYNSLYTFVTDYLNQSIINDHYGDLTYQEVADHLGCRIIINTLLQYYHTKSIGVSSNSPSNYGGGRTESYLYERPTYAIKNSYETENKRKQFCKDLYPTTVTSETIIEIHPNQLEADDYQLTTQMKKRGTFDACPCCWQRDGRMWMLKGTGNKSRSKNKGMRKRRFEIE